MEPSDSEEIKEDDGYHEVKISDNDLPICFNQDSHLESITGSEYVAQIWRNKERVQRIFSTREKSCLAFKGTAIFLFSSILHFPDVLISANNSQIFNSI